MTRSAVIINLSNGDGEDTNLIHAGYADAVSVDTLKPGDATYLTVREDEEHAVILKGVRRRNDDHTGVDKDFEDENGRQITPWFASGIGERVIESPPHIIVPTNIYAPTPRETLRAIADRITEGDARQLLHLLNYRFGAVVQEAVNRG